ncbi:MAG: CDP-alcohol phosphatidyltransferase family protein [Candidatus Poribacteria bacterium]|nr:CDP-alcohol phosphatidyltransferase family protein [Candidatus Poribacteria bacterium]
MLANTITLGRVFFTFGVIALFRVPSVLNRGIPAAIVLIFTLDAVDGLVARKYNQTTKLGAILDPIADRIIENTFWIYFTVTGLTPLWMPVTILTSGFLIDNLQPYINPSKNGWTHLLIRSYTSQALCGIAKMSTFLFLASISIFKPENTAIESAGTILVNATIAFCLIRGTPSLVIVWKNFRR